MNLIVSFVLVNVVLSCWILGEIIEGNIEPFEVSARNIYDNTEMNMFGCIIISLLIMFFTSVYHIPAFIVWIVYKLFHVGRRG